MGKKSRDKGARTERAIVKLLQECGFAAEKMPLSGACGGKFSGDVSVPLLGVDRKIEVKCRADGFKQIYDWLEGKDGHRGEKGVGCKTPPDFLVIKADYKEPLVVLPLRVAAEIAAIAEASRAYQALPAVDGPIITVKKFDFEELLAKIALENVHEEVK